MGSKYSSTFDESKPPIPAVNFCINGKKYSICPDGIKITATTSLNTFIRNVAELKGTKVMCSEGGCGSCIVAAQFIHPLTQREILIAVNSCLVSVLSCQGWSITTIEGIGNSKNGYNLLQKHLAEFNGSQCGFCSPGMVMNMYCLQKNQKNLTQKEIEDSFGGNICRCTGYRSIAEAFKSFANDADPRLRAKCKDIENINECLQRNTLCEGCELIDKSQNHLVINLGTEKWLKVYTILELIQIISVIKNMKYMLVAGNTAHGIYRRDSDIKVFVDVNHIPELHDVQINKNLVLGANTTIADAIKLFQKIASERYDFGYLKEIADHYELIANIPVRNIGTLAGNLMIKHSHPRFQSDIFLTLETFRAKLQVINKDGNVSKSYTPQDFLNLDMSGKVIVSIKFYPLSKNYVYRTYKIMPRAQSVYAIVNAGFLFELKTDNATVSNATIVYGAINANFIQAKKTEKLLVDKNLFEDETLQAAFKCLDSEIVCDDAAPEPKPEERKQLAISLFYKFILSIAPIDTVDDYFKSGGDLLERPVSSSHQFYQTNETEYPVTIPIPKLEAVAQCAGEAKYVIDHDVSRKDFTFGSFILARTTPGSIIKNIIVDEAMKFPGVLAVLLSSDIPGDNSFTPTQAQFISLDDEEIFCSRQVKYNGQPVGLVVAETEDIARRATSLVQLEYDLSVSKENLVFTTQDAVNIIHNSRIKHVKTIDRKHKGNNVKKIIRGKFNIGHQYHFTMETQSCIAVPTEDGLDVFPSTQWMDIAQSAIARCCKIPNNRINMNVRRLGGGYGGKITRANLVCCASAIAAIKLKQPVYLRMPLEDNTEALGKRFPCLSEYEIGVDENGKIQFLNTSIWSNLGCLSNEAIFLGIIPEAMISCYDDSTWEIKLYTVTTDVPTNTSCRAPGTNEGLALIETIMDHIATKLNKDVREVRLQNMKLENNPLPTLLSEFEKESNLEERLLSCKEFNHNNRWKKRGIGVATIIWPFELFSNFYSQVVIYGDDGTVAISHGGMEMGQGINTRVAQAAAYTLKIDLDMIQIKPTNNFNAPNNFLTGGSATSSSVCFATIEACKILLKRLEPIKNQLKTYNWPDMIRESRKQNIDLSATYQFDPFTDKRITNYKVFGVTFSEVEVDLLTGQHLLKRVDILEDVGQSINPGIDIGQIEGAFCFGLGYWLTEEVLFDKNDGKLLNNRTWNYHVVGMKDIPVDWRISLRKDAPNLQGVLRSKATGEPPLCMSVSVPLAIRQALISSRNNSDPNQSPWFDMDGPTTISSVLMNSLPKYEQYRLKGANRVVVKL